MKVAVLLLFLVISCNTFSQSKNVDSLYLDAKLNFEKSRAESFKWMDVMTLYETVIDLNLKHSSKFEIIIIDKKKQNEKIETR